MDFGAVLAGTIAAFVVGGIWFGPKTFYPLWWKALGKSPSQEPGDGYSMPVVFGATFISQLIQAVFLTWLMNMLDYSGVVAGAEFGLLMGFAFAAMPSLSHRLFGQQGFTVWAIEVGGDIASLTAMGAVIGALL